MLNLILATALLAAPLAAAPPPTHHPAPAAASTRGAIASVQDPLVELQTSQGNIVLQLYPGKSPKSVANFLEYVRSGFYDGTTFHRVIPGYLIQGGLYTRQLKPKRTRPPVQAEADNGLSNVRGTIAVARGAAPDSGTSQFFINLVDNRRLDYVNNQSGLTWGYTVFGRVVDGMKVVDRIGGLPTHPQGPFAGDVPQPLVVIEHAAVIGQVSDDATDAQVQAAARKDEAAAQAPSAAGSTAPPAAASTHKKGG